MTRVRQGSHEGSGWLPIEEELIRDGYLARVTRDRYGTPPRWRWAVAQLDQVQRWLHKVVQHAYARGYCRSRERAMKMAESAIVALQKAEKAAKKAEKETIAT